MTRSLRWPRRGAALVGFLWYLFIGGAGTLNPRAIDWLMAGDWRQHWLGFLFFRREPWTWPLGKVSSLLYPIGTNIGFTDSNPLVSIVLKPFSAWLPDEFQVVGLWLAACFALQGYFGAALASTVTPHRVQQFLGGALIAMSPVLAARIGHDTLCAQWMLIALLYLGLRDVNVNNGSRGVIVATILAVASAAIHPYLAAMAFALALAVVVRTWRAGALSLTAAAIAGLVATTGVLGVFGAIGYFGEAGTASAGFGLYSADLTAFIDPREFSRVLPDLRTSVGHWEGLGCLGLGGVIAAAVALVRAVRARPTLQTGAWIVVSACLLMAVYALSSDVTFHNKHVLNLRGLYTHLSFITGPFRASGRFIWPLHYLVLVAGVWGITRFFTSVQAATAALGAVVVLQAVDYKPARWMLEEKHFRQAAPDLSLATGRYQHMAVYPMQVANACGDDYQEDHVYRFMLAAYRLKMTFNAGIYARLPMQRTVQVCTDLFRNVESGRLDPQTLYVVTREYVPQFTKAGAICGRFDGDAVCVSRDSDDVFRTFLETGRRPDGK